MRSSVRRAAAAAAVLLSMPASSPLLAAETGWVSIRSIPLEDYLPARQINRLVAQSRSSAEETAKARVARTAFLVETPEGAGPFPAVFFLHGCNGVLKEQYRSWDKWYLARGYAFVLIDSFRPRQLAQVCSSGNMPLFDARVGDVYAVLYYLAAHRHTYKVDPRRIVITGFSHGGVAVIDAMRTGTRLKLMRKYSSTLQIAGGFAFYPHCTGNVRPVVYNPVIMLSGAQDSYASPKPCRNWLKQPASPISAPLEIHVFADAGHAFDYLSHYTPRLAEDGYVAKYDPIARKKSEEIIDKFLSGLDRRLAARRTAAERARLNLAGNTLRLRLRNGRTALQYLDTDGTAPMVVGGGRRFGNLQWHMDDDGDLCRTSVRTRRDVCLPVMVKSGEMVLYRANGKVAHKVAVLGGNRLPKRGTSAGPAGMSPENGIGGGKMKRWNGARRKN